MCWLPGGVVGLTGSCEVAWVGGDAVGEEMFGLGILTNLPLMDQVDAEGRELLGPGWGGVDRVKVLGTDEASRRYKDLVGLMWWWLKASPHLSGAVRAPGPLGVP